MSLRTSVVVCLAAAAVGCGGGEARPDPAPNLEYKLDRRPPLGGMLMALSGPPPGLPGLFPSFDLYLIDERSKWIVTVNRLSDEPDHLSGRPGLSEPVMSPDGLHVAFLMADKGHHGEPALYLYDRPTGTVTELAPSTTGLRAAGPRIAWHTTVRDASNRLRGRIAVSSFDAAASPAMVAPHADDSSMGTIHLAEDGATLVFAEQTGDIWRIVSVPAASPENRTVLREFTGETFAMLHEFVGGMVYYTAGGHFVFPLAQPGNETKLEPGPDGFASTIRLHKATDGRVLFTAKSRTSKHGFREPGFAEFLSVGELAEPQAAQMVTDDDRHIRVHALCADGRWVAFATFVDDDRQNLLLADLAQDQVEPVLIADRQSPGGMGGLAFHRYFIFDDADEALIYVHGNEVRRISLHQPRDPVVLADLPSSGMGELTLVPGRGLFVLRSAQNWVGSTTVPGPLTPLVSPRPEAFWVEATFLPFP